MNIQRISVSLPKPLCDQLTNMIAPGKISRFVSRAIQNQLLEDNTDDPVNDFIALRKRLPKISRRQILAAINKGRQ